MAIEYNITRPIPIRWFAPVVYFFGLIVVGLLTVLNGSSSLLLESLVLTYF